MKMEEYMASKLSGIFQVKLVAKIVVFGSLGSQDQAVCVVWCLLLKKHKRSKQDCYNLVFSLLHSILIWFVSKKSHFVYIIEYFLLLVTGEK